MSFLTWLGLRPGSRSVRASGKPTRTCRLQVERLEDRAVPANYSAATVPDLIAAMNAANLTAEADTIALVGGTTYTLTEVNNTANGATGLPTIAAGEGLTIQGNGGVIERNTASGIPAFRLFDVAVGAALTLDNLTLQGGLAYGYGVSASGGAIYSQGTLTLNHVTVQNNQALGAAGWNATYSSGRGGGSVYPATNGASAYGGGLYIGSGSALLTDVTLSANTAQGGKGGDGLTFGGGGGGPRGDQYGGSKVPAANGGSGLGGGLYAAGGTITIRNSSSASNGALAGAAGKGEGGSAGQGVGGGFYIESDVLAVLDAFTLSHFKRNKASTSNPDIYGPYTVGS